MSILPTHLMKNPQRLLSLISMRQEALSDNIANMHTPGYKRKDVNFSQYINTQGAASNLENKMIQSFGSAPISSSESTEAMSVENELSLMQENYLYYSVAARQLSSVITEIRSALNMQTS